MRLFYIFVRSQKTYEYFLYSCHTSLRKTSRGLSSERTEQNEVTGEIATSDEPNGYSKETDNNKVDKSQVETELNNELPFPKEKNDQTLLEKRKQKETKNNRKTSGTKKSSNLNTKPVDDSIKNVDEGAFEFILLYYIFIHIKSLTILLVNQYEYFLISYHNIFWY